MDGLNTSVLLGWFAINFNYYYMNGILFCNKLAN